MADETEELIEALGREDEKTVRAMLKANPSLLKARDGNGLEPVHHAAMLQSIEILKYLISLGADVNVQCFHGLMPLHYAGSKEVMDFLLTHGALVDSENNYFGKTPLHYAALKGDIESMKLLISHGANINARDLAGRSPLHCALSRGNKEAALFLQKHGAGILDIHTAAALGIMNKLKALLDSDQVSVNVPEYRGRTSLYFSETGEGRTALHYTVMYRQLKAAKYLISRGADVNAKTMHDVTPLECAAERGYRDMVELLITNGADLNSRGTLGMTPLFWAAMRGHEDIAQLLVLKGADTEAENDSGETLLHSASLGNCINLMRTLIEKGYDVNAAKLGGGTPLHNAASVEAAGLLIEHGADIEAREGGGDTPLHYMTILGNRMEVLKFLVSKGARVDTRSDRGFMPLHCAAMSNNIEMAEFFLSHGADINAHTTLGETPLDWAIRQNNAAITEFLIRHGAREGFAKKEKRRSDYPFLYCNEANVEYLIDRGMDVNAVQMRGMTFLHCAIACEKITLAELLISHGADVNIKDNDGFTPLHWTAFRNAGSLPGFLLSHGAEINARDSRGCTPLHLAAREGKREMVEELLSRGADLEAEDKSGWTALCTAVSMGYRELADILTEKGARRPETMEAAEFFAAVKGGDVSTVESLVEKNPALLCSKDSSRKAPLHVAAQEGHDAIVTFLVSRGADVNAGDDCGRTALHSAALSRQLKTVEALIAAGADANIKDRDGEKPNTFLNREIADLLRRHQTWE